MIRIIQDSREQLAYPFTGPRYDCTVEVGALATGDYSLAGFEDRIAVERKSLDDLIGCLTKGRERFERELARAMHLERFKIVVEAGYSDIARGMYTSKMQPHAALQSLESMEIKYGAHFHYAGSREGAEYATYSFLEKYLRDIETRYKLASKCRTLAPVKEGAA